MLRPPPMLRSTPPCWMTSMPRSSTSIARSASLLRTAMCCFGRHWFTTTSERTTRPSRHSRRRLSMDSPLPPYGTRLTSTTCTTRPRMSPWSRKSRLCSPPSVHIIAGVASRPSPRASQEPGGRFISQPQRTDPRHKQRQHPGFRHLRLVGFIGDGGEGGIWRPATAAQFDEQRRAVCYPGTAGEVDGGKSTFGERLLKAASEGVAAACDRARRHWCRYINFQRREGHPTRVGKVEGASAGCVGGERKTQSNRRK